MDILRLPNFSFLIQRRHEEIPEVPKVDILLLTVNCFFRFSIK